MKKLIHSGKSNPSHFGIQEIKPYIKAPKNKTDDKGIKQVFSVVTAFNSVLFIGEKEKSPLSSKVGKLRRAPDKKKPVEIAKNYNFSLNELINSLTAVSSVPLRKWASIF